MLIRIFLFSLFIGKLYAEVECENGLPIILEEKLVQDKIKITDVINHNKLVNLAEILSENNAKMRKSADQILEQR